MKILVVEDEAIVALDLRNMLRRMGFQVPLIALTGEEALAFAAQIRPALIFMDIGLNGPVDGIEVAEQIRARFAIPIVFVTAYSDAKTRQRAEMTAPAAYLSKPFTVAEISSALETALGVRV